MIGHILNHGDLALKAIARLFIKPAPVDPRIDALAVRSAAKDALRRAKVRGDTRTIGERQKALTAATTALLVAEIRAVRR